jgi:hypothetical protein
LNNFSSIAPGDVGVGDGADRREDENRNAEVPKMN